MIPAIFSAFKLSSLVIFQKNITPMVISTKMIYLILIFSLPILPPVLVQSALLFPFFELYYQIVLLSIHFFISS